MNAQKVLIPLLRFTQDDGTAFPDWQEKKLGELGSFLGGGTPDTNEISNWEGDIPWISSSDISEESVTTISVTRKISSLALVNSATKLVPSNSLLIVSRVGVGKFAVSKIELCTSQDFCNFTPKDDNVIFIAYWLSCNRNSLLSLCQGTSIKGLTSVDLKNLNINLPHPDEQQKIADYLGAVDAKLRLLERRRGALSNYKKAMMQRIFSQEIRFTQDDDTAFPDWQKKRLNQVGVRVSEKNSNESVSFVLTNSAVQGIVSQQDYFDKDIANTSNLGGYYVVKKGDFIYNPRISVHAPVGPIKRSAFKIGVMSPLYTVFRLRNQTDVFYEQYFTSSFWFKYLKTVANYGARHDRMAITTGDFMAMPLPCPHPDEQQKIADFLSAIDDKISAAARQISAMQDFKKSMLQQMFV